MTVRRIHIERLDLDLRGMSPEVAQAAVAVLGPALAGELRSQPPTLGNYPKSVDAGQFSAPRSPTADGLAATIAGGIARSLRGAS